MGYFFTEKEAREAVEKNVGDIHEDLYDWCIIERFKPGILTVGAIIQWYEWDTDKWVEAKVPEKYKNVCNWAFC